VNWWIWGFVLIPFYTAMGSIMLFLFLDIMLNFKLSNRWTKWRTSVKKKKKLTSTPSASPKKCRHCRRAFRLNLPSRPSLCQCRPEASTVCFYCGMNCPPGQTAYGEVICNPCLTTDPTKLLAMHQRYKIAARKVPKGGVVAPLCCAMCGTPAKLSLGLCGNCVALMTSPGGMNIPVPPSSWAPSPMPNCTCGAASSVPITYHSQHCAIFQDTPQPPRKELPLNQQYVGGLRLIRGWAVEVGLGNGGSLRSLASSFKWTGDVMKAHKTPSLGELGCGFFGFYRWDWSQNELMGVGLWGTYIGWGRTVRGSMGMRTEYAKLEALCFNPRIAEISSSERDKVQKYAPRIAEALGVPLLDHSELEHLKTGIISLDQNRIDSWLDQSK